MSRVGCPGALVPWLKGERGLFPCLASAADGCELVQDLCLIEGADWLCLKRWLLISYSILSFLFLE